MTVIRGAAEVALHDGVRYGQTDDWCYNTVDKPRLGVHIHDLNATILHVPGLDHSRLSYPLSGARLPPRPESKITRPKHDILV